MLSPLSRATWIVLLIITPHLAFAQGGRGGSMRPLQRMSVVVMLGITNPQGHERLREFWLNGPGGSAEFRIHFGSLFSLGAGGDLSLLYFNEAAFNASWPGVPLQAKQNLFLGSVYLDGAYAPLPSSTVRPYAKGQLGAAFMTKASYHQVIAGVRTTFYSVGGTARLALGVAAGVSFALDYSFSLLAEVKATYVHNDPAVGLLLYGRGGVQYKF